MKTSALGFTLLIAYSLQAQQKVIQLSIKEQRQVLKTGNKRRLKLITLNLEEK